MFAYVKCLLGLIIYCYLSTSFAITVTVSSATKNISALGFTVNGQSHGGMGSAYRATNMPSGQYSFGIRVGGAITGTDVPCPLANGHRYVNLKNDTRASLAYNGQRCLLTLN